MAGDLQGREGTETYDDEDIVVEHEFSVEDLQSAVQEREACNMESAAVEGAAFDGLMIEVKEEEKDIHVAIAVGSVELALEEESDINLQQQPQTVSVQESRERPYEEASSVVEATDAQEKNLDDAPMHNGCGVAAMLSRDHHLQEVGREQLEDCANVTEIEPRTGTEEEALLDGEAAASPGAPPPSEGVIETKDGVGPLEGEGKKPVHEDDDAIIMAAACEVEEDDDGRAAAVAAAAEDDGIALLPMDTSQKTIATTTSDQGSKEAMALFTEAMTGGGALQVNAAGGEEQSDSEGGLDSWEIKQRKSERACNTKLTLGQPDVTTSELVVDDLPVTSMVAPTDLITAVTTYGDSGAAREEVLLSGGFQHGPQQVVDEHQLHVDTDKHLEQAQIHAQETMATATAVLAQSQLVWARIHSQHPSDLGAAREVQIASLAATVAAAASVAKAAVEAARAIGAASSNVVAPSQSLPFGAAQATSNEHPQKQNTNRAIIEIRQNVEALESVVQAAGFAAQAATQGAVMAIGNPLKQATRMANYWKRKVAEMEGDANPKGRKNQSHKKTKLAKSRGVGEIFSGKKTPKKQALWTQSSPGTTPLKKLKGKEGLHHTGSSPVTMPKKMKDKQALHTRSSPVTTTLKKMKDNKQALHCSGSSPRTTPKKKKEKNVSSSSSSKREVFIKGKAVEQGKKAGGVRKSQSKQNAAAAAKKQKKKMTAMPEMTPRYAALQLAGVATTQSPDLRELVTRNNTPEVISEGSVVEVRAVSGVLHSHHRPLSPLYPHMHNKMEVMSEEEGLRGGWFSAKVLTLTETEALVVYDELLTDDGSSNLKEWFPLKDSVAGNGILRRMRPVHPFVFIKDGGSRARRRVALGSQIWSVGDHVDAFLQDGWWEGVVKDVKDMDENKITLYFPGEDDTAVVKTWNVRPSLTWKDGVWGPWTGSGKDEGGQFAKQQKYESSPNDKGKKLTKKRKLLELREDAPEADSPPRSVPRLLPEGNTSSSVSHAHRKLAEVSNALSTPPKHRLSSAAATMVTIPKSTKKKLKAPEPGVPMTRQQSAAESDERQRPRNPMLPTSQRRLERA